MPLFINDSSFADPADLLACRKLLSNGSKSFYAASFFLPKRLREPATALYAFCRLADDAIDDNPEDHQVALAGLRDRLDRAYRGEPINDPADRAFAGAIERFDIPRELPEALLEGFEWDAEGRVYQDLSGVYAYSSRVAAAVGAMMAAIMGVRSPSVLARACDLGTAMQISNICRDVGEDARNGRIYLPLDWLREAGLDPDAWLQRPVFNEVIRDVVKRMLDTADELYQRAEAGIAKLPTSCRPGIYAARLLYAEIGQEIARNGYDSVSQRAVVSPARKMTLLGRAMAVTPLPIKAVCTAEPLEENRFLVDALAIEDPELTDGTVSGKVLWVLDLFHQLEERERAQAGGLNQAAAVSS
ncbi:MULTISPECIES: phytoene/squalene synthase family protein [Thiorhodovibrio]|jgi:phytoene synthase|uniref:phytoene/squalene synthase family protein n=1 Tax=Thiorhodovibrio TaxID=61593 RepID=UPI001911D91C|nr:MULTISPECIES: phytoene/squalene synthase family protein [Thiorhodovibrio]MBK5969882.1 phytoene synthase [Thiorhodovibrio winogradskyi]WPL12073.1 phytoene synthase [Thiorhodovibrio litoralis]